jgi:hypothetical protein
MAPLGRGLEPKVSTTVTSHSGRLAVCHSCNVFRTAISTLSIDISLFWLAQDFRMVTAMTVDTGFQMRLRRSDWKRQIPDALGGAKTGFNEITFSPY